MKRIRIESLEELHRLETTIAEAAAATANRLAQALEETKDLSTLARLRFDQSGCDPLDLTRALNFVEQLNQSFTYLASIGGVRWLLEHHALNAPFDLNLGTAAGSDIVSADGGVAAETFAATHPESNDKMRKDLKKVAASLAKHRYVFYLSPVESTRTSSEVTIVRLDYLSVTR